jgi:hypothetical protein
MPAITPMESLDIQRFYTISGGIWKFSLLIHATMLMEKLAIDKQLILLW